MAAWSNEVRGVAVHHTATNAPASQPHSTCIAQAEAIARDHARDGYHLDDDSLEDGETHYNSLRCPHGIKVGGRGLKSTSDANGNKTVNRSLFATAFLGSSPRMNAAMEKGLREDIQLVEDKLMSGKPALLVPHRELTSTTCPGAHLANWCDDYHEEEVLAFTKDEKKWLENLANQGLSNDVKPWQVRDAAERRHDKEHTHDGGGGSHTHTAKVTIT